MTANVAQKIVDPDTWQKTLRGAYEALRLGGRLVFETRDQAGRAWEEWTREHSYRVTEIPGVGTVESWVQLIDLSWPLVTFRWTYIFAADGQVLTSNQDEVLPGGGLLVGRDPLVEQVRPPWGLFQRCASRSATRS